MMFLVSFVIESQQAHYASPHGLVYAFDLGPDGYNLSDEEGADSPRPRRLFRHNKQALSSGKFRGQLNLGAYSSKLS
jgi:hypothetical protein